MVINSIYSNVLMLIKYKYRILQVFFFNQMSLLSEHTILPVMSQNYLIVTDFNN